MAKWRISDNSFDLILKPDCTRRPRLGRDPQVKQMIDFSLLKWVKIDLQEQLEGGRIKCRDNKQNSLAVANPGMDSRCLIFIFHLKIAYICRLESKTYNFICIEGRNPLLVAVSDLYGGSPT